ncbi:unnamed protein product [Bodo saltans]|uniref:Uncharacterized protein n=1 Tax=Bodo saltans TaxID=75058 RepID=A0A0S4JM34_BODSA|nr:unnamed protein product [Bodo saltans]|eukprot:CUG90980.1 unnamed protein product [Bodo saltans]
MNSLEEAWSTRPAAYRRVSKDYQTAQKRLLFFLAVEENSRFPYFLDWCNEKKLRKSTIANYWQVVLAAASAINLQVPAHHARDLAWAQTQAAAELPMAAQAMSWKNVVEMWNCHRDEAALVILVTFILGQRVSDMLLLIRERVTVCRNTITLTMVQGKVIRFIGPYSLYLSASSECRNDTTRVHHVSRSSSRQHVPPGGGGSDSAPTQRAS